MAKDCLIPVDGHGNGPWLPGFGILLASINKDIFGVPISNVEQSTNKNLAPYLFDSVSSGNDINVQ